MAKTFSVLQRVGQSLMIPVSVLPAAGLMVALGRLLQGENPDQRIQLLVILGKFMFSGGLAIFEHLAVVFAIGVAIGFTGGAGVAGLAAAAGYYTLTNVLKVMSEVRGLELAINTGVFGGIIIGLIVAQLYQRYHETRLHPVFGFFSGKRLVPIVSVFVAIITGVILGFVWPPIQSGINQFGHWAMNSLLGPAFYAAGKRLLIPVGLHHVYYPPFLFEFGEYVTSAGQVLKGESARYFAGDPTAGRFMASEFPIMLFGLPAAALAMYLRAIPSKRKAIGGVMLSAALTSIITGITEPIEFAFIFVAPVLFVFHVGAAFVSGLLTGIFDIHFGYTFSASLIDYAIGLFNAKGSFWFWTVVGPGVGLTYFAVFYWAIGFFNLATPGREADQSDDQASPKSGPIGSQKSAAVLSALGGASNIKTLDACITRLRVTLNNPGLLNESALKALGCSGVMKAGANIQAIFGVESDLLKEDIRKLLKGGFSLVSPLAGTVLNLSEVPDQTFSQKILGDGFAINPTKGELVAPCAAKVVQVFRTKHAVGLQADGGLEILLHVGIDTVKMDGEGFVAHVQEGDQVAAGQKLLTFDLDLIRQKAKSTITPIVITNSDQLKGLTVTAVGKVVEAGAVVAEGSNR